MDAENWNKFCKVFNLDVNVTVKKTIDRSDKGEFIFKGKNGGFTQMDLSRMYQKASKEQIRSFKKILWDQVEEFLLKPKEVRIINKGGNEK